MANITFGRAISALSKQSGQIGHPDKWSGLGGGKSPDIKYFVN